MRLWPTNNQAATDRRCINQRAPWALRENPESSSMSMSCTGERYLQYLHRCQSCKFKLGCSIFLATEERHKLRHSDFDPLGLLSDLPCVCHEVPLFRCPTPSLCASEVSHLVCTHVCRRQRVRALTWLREQEVAEAVSWSSTGQGYVSTTLHCRH